MTDEIDYLAEFYVTHLYQPTSCHQHAFLFILEVVFNIWLFLGTLAAQVLVVLQGDCSSGPFSLIGFRFVGCPASSGMKCMGDP